MDSTDQIKCPESSNQTAPTDLDDLMDELDTGGTLFNCTAANMTTQVL